MKKLALILAAAMIVGCGPAKIPPKVEFGTPIVDISPVKRAHELVHPLDINWIDAEGLDPYEISEHHEKAEKNNKIVLMYFYSQDEECEDCFAMSYYSFMDEKVMETVNKYYYPMRTNLDKMPELKELLTTLTSEKCNPSLFKLPVVSIFPPIINPKLAIEFNGYMPADRLNEHLLGIAEYAKR